MIAHATPSEEPDAPVWALLAKRPGDNAQIETLARATGLPFAVRRLYFRKGFEVLPNLRQRGSLFSLTGETQRSLLAAAPPKLIIAAGKRSACAALWFKARHGVRLVHLGRSWAPHQWFDLIVTTPQYAQNGEANVLRNRFPLTAPSEPVSVPEDLAALPRPRLLVAFGGNAVGMRLDDDAVRAMARRALERLDRDGGSLMVATSPRTSPGAVAALRTSLKPEARVLVSIFGEGRNRYRDFLGAADAALVTGDSVSMVAEAAATGRPVEIFDLPKRPEPAALLRRSLDVAGLADRAGALGLIDTGRSIAAYMAGLREEGWLDGGRAADRMAKELAAAAIRARAFAL